MEATQHPTVPNAETLTGRRGYFLRFLESPFFWAVFIVAAFGLPLARSLLRESPPQMPVLGSLPPFKLRDQNNLVVGPQNFRGTVLVVNFIFTSCPDTCPLLTGQMRKIQERLRNVENKVRLVSISVDPSNDSPTVLREYGKKFGADFARWSFLTGPIDAIEKVVVAGFKVPLDRGPAPSLMSITHGENFVLVDQAAQIRAYLRADNDDDIDRLLRRVTILANSNPPRAVGAL